MVCSLVSFSLCFFLSFILNVYTVFYSQLLDELGCGAWKVPTTLFSRISIIGKLRTGSIAMKRGYCANSDYVGASVAFHKSTAGKSAAIDAIRWNALQNRTMWIFDLSPDHSVPDIKYLHDFLANSAWVWLLWTMLMPIAVFLLGLWSLWGLWGYNMRENGKLSHFDFVFAVNFMADRYVRSVPNQHGVTFSCSSLIYVVTSWVRAFRWRLFSFRTSLKCGRDEPKGTHREYEMASNGQWPMANGYVE